MTHSTLALTVGGAAVAVSLSGSVASSAGAVETPTFAEHVAPIVFANCTSCHRPGEAAPFSLMTYDEVRTRGRIIAAATASRQMPPWKAGPGDYPFRNARGLSEAEIDTIQRWVAAGMPEGDRRRQPALPAFTPGWELGPPDLVVAMPEPYTVPADGPDIYRNFVLPLNLDRDVWVRAIDFRPSARAVVHHSLFFLDTTGTARRMDERDEAPGYHGGMGGTAGLSIGAGGGRGLAGLLLAGGRGGAGSQGGGAPPAGRGGAAQSAAASVADRLNAGLGDGHSEPVRGNCPMAWPTSCRKAPTSSCPPISIRQAGWSTRHRPWACTSPMRRPSSPSRPSSFRRCSVRSRGSTSRRVSATTRSLIRSSSRST